MNKKFVDCTIQDKEGVRHCNFQRQKASPMKLSDLSVQGAKAVEPFNSDTFPAKLDNRHQQKDSKEWDIKNDRSTINMVPSFKATRGNQTDNAWNSVLEYQTGDFLNREFQKREITPHFTPYKDNVPNKNYTYISTRDDNDFGLSQRLSIHKYKESERPTWSWTQVGPGLNKGYTNCGSEGFHPFWRSPVPTYEELTGRTRPEFDFRNHVIYGRMENMANATTDLMEQTKEIKPTAWQDDRYRFHSVNRNNQGERGRAQVVMNIDRKLDPHERYGTSRGPDVQTKRDSTHNQSRQRSSNLNEVGVMNPNGPEAGQLIDHTTMQSQIVNNLRRNNLEQLPLGPYDRVDGALGALNSGIASFEKDAAIKRRNIFLMESLRTGNVAFDVADNQYILPKDLAPGTKKQDIIKLLHRTVIDNQADNWYLDTAPPDPTLKEFLIYNLYTPTIDTKATSIHSLPQAPKPTIKQSYIRPARGEQITTKFDTGPYLMPQAPKDTRKDQVASMGGFVRAGGDSSAPMSQPTIQLNSDRAVELRKSAPSAKAVPVFDRDAPIMTQQKREVDSSRVGNRINVADQDSIAPRSIGMDTQRSNKMSTSVVNSRLGF